MAHKKGQGSSRNGRDSPGQHRGVKIYGGQAVISGNIIVRQVGTLIHPGKGVGLGRDFTIYATTDGFVTYEPQGRNRKMVSVYTAEQLAIRKAKADAPVAAKKLKAPAAAKPAGKPAAKAAPAAKA